MSTLLIIALVAGVMLVVGGSFVILMVATQGEKTSSGSGRYPDTGWIDVAGVVGFVVAIVALPILAVTLIIIIPFSSLITVVVAVGMLVVGGSFAILMAATQVETSPGSGKYEDKGWIDVAGVVGFVVAIVALLILVGTLIAIIPSSDGDPLREGDRCFPGQPVPAGLECVPVD